jgi:outer membrane protein assembly factor BamB
MNINQIDAPRKPLRLWPGVAAVVLQWLAWLVVPLVVPGSAGAGILVGVACGLMVILWWLFFSRAPWLERVGALALMVAAWLATKPLLHESIRTGMMGNMFMVYAIPALSLALVVWAVVSRGRSSGFRQASMVVAIVLACGVFTLLRTDGVSGDADSDLEWRWTPTAEERLLAQTRDEPAVPASAPPPAQPKDATSAPATSPAAAEGPEARVPAEAVEKSTPPPSTATAARTSDRPAAAAAVQTRSVWPGFRGPNRDSVIRGVQIETDWSKSPPVALWRKAIGPGWSSFAVHGDRFFTQEQRGDDEIVSAYSLKTGEPVWRHRDGVRFYESNGGAGPRGTPTVHDGRVFTFGATGVVNALDAGNGAVIWSRNAATDTGAEIPGWGFASSPLVINDVVIVAASGRLVGYDIATGHPRWVRRTRGGGYSSPHLATIGGVAQVLLLSGGGATSVSPADGTLLWELSSQSGVSIVQPGFADNGELLITAGDMMGGTGMRRVAVTRGAAGWTVDERWSSRGLKPYFNDFIVHKGHAFGFDGSILSCIDLANGERMWKGGRYGHGQLVLLPEQDAMLVLSEEGELALVKAAPDKFTELARFKAIEGKTWNHPALIGDLLLVRNGEEMAAFRLSLQSTPSMSRRR